jgi:YggT family protein
MIAGILINIIQLAYWALFILMIVRIILSFTGMSPYHPFYQQVLRLTEPLLEPIRRILPPMGGLDFSPMIVLIAASFIQRILISTIVAGF